jgi:hypothetical protein
MGPGSLGGSSGAEGKPEVGEPPPTAAEKEVIAFDRKVQLLSNSAVLGNVRERRQTLMPPTRRHRTQVHAAMMFAVLLAVGALVFGGFTGAAAAKKPEKLEFDMVVSAGAALCLPNASGHVTLQAAGDNQRMRVEVEGLPPNTAFTLFVLQVPTGPFAMSWYQGDIQTNGDGRDSKSFLGIFSRETFIFAPATRVAPQTDFADAPSNPPTAPVHMYHLGIWFSDPADGANAGCPGTTPFDGDHVAGIQVLNTRNFGTEAADGPLGQFEP